MIAANARSIVGKFANQKSRVSHPQLQAPKLEPTPKVEPIVSDEQQLQEFTKQRDELNRNIEQLRTKLADRAEVAALRKQLEQLQAQFAEEQKLRKNLEGAYQVGVSKLLLTSIPCTPNIDTLGSGSSKLCKLSVALACVICDLFWCQPA